MRPLQSLTFEAIIEELWGSFSQAKDPRSSNQVNYSIPATLMSGLAVFFFQHPSLLNFQRKMESKKGRSNLRTMFKVREVPSDSQIRAILDEVNPEIVRKMIPRLFEKMRVAGWGDEYKTVIRAGKNKGSYYTCAIDGSGYFHSGKISCENCLTKTNSKTGEVDYYHQVMAATLVKAGSRRILPLEAEQISNKDGQEKQDCEQNAGKRLIKRLRKEHPQIKMIITGDDLQSREPMIKECLGQGFDYVFIAKESSHPEMMEWVEDLDKMGESLHGKWEEEAKCQRKYYEYRIVPNVPLTKSDEVMTNYLEVWEKNKEGKQTYHNSWVTNLEVTAENVKEIVGIGRSKWKIENEHFNIQKNHGYELEHNFGHGKKHLAEVFYLLNLLAFILHKIIERGDAGYRKCFAKGEAIREVWETLKIGFAKILFESWRDLVEFCYNDDWEKEINSG